MEDSNRRQAARERAEEYAPRPESSFLMYGVVGTVIAGIALFAFSRFYSLDPLAYPLWVVAALVLVFAGSLLLRIVRSSRHHTALRDEYDKTESR
jgi:O-antigen/teichoic acid export membrane protein